MTATSVPVRERPIIFDGESVRAILSGRKTQTRRVVKLNPAYVERWKAAPSEDWARECPYGQRRECLWVRESWAPVSPDENERPIRECNIEYRADTPGAKRAGHWDAAPDDAEAIRWRSSILMPRWASRLLLRIKRVRIERLRDISEDDMRAEGIAGVEPGELYFNLITRWDALNAKRGYPEASNPWVWALTFARVSA